MLPTFEVFGLSVPMFGVMMMCGMVAAFILLAYCRKFVRFSEDQLLTAALWAIILGFLGSKILFWLVELDQVIANPHYILETLRSGFVFYGAFIGGVLGLGIYSKKAKLPFFAFLDLFVAPLVLGQAFGRIGCFCAGCCYGSPSDCAIAVTYPPGGSAPAGVPLLPTQLIESAFLFLLAISLVLLLKRKKPFGTVTGWYMVCYGVFRFVIEFFRSDDRGGVGTLSTSQFLGIFIVLGGVVLLTLVRRGVLTKRELDDPAEPEPEEALFTTEDLDADVTQDEMVILVAQAAKAAAEKAQQEAEEANAAQTDGKDAPNASQADDGNPSPTEPKETSQKESKSE